jgi:hypothetical protein
MVKRLVLVMAEMASALTDDWESSRVLVDRLGFAGMQVDTARALGGLVAKRKALRRGAPRGSAYRYEYRRA